MKIHDYCSTCAKYGAQFCLLHSVAFRYEQELKKMRNDDNLVRFTIDGEYEDITDKLALPGVNNDQKRNV